MISIRIPFSSFFNMILLLVVCLCIPSNAYSDPAMKNDNRLLRIHSDKPVYTMAPWMDIFENPDGRLTFSDVVQPDINSKYQVNKTQCLNFGVTPSVFWLKFSLLAMPGGNPSATQVRVLDIGEAFPGRINWALYNAQSGDLIGSGGSRNARDTYARIQVLHQPQTFYLKVASTTGFMMCPRLFAWEPYLDHINHHNVWFGVFYGILIAVIVYNMVLFFSFKDHSYLWYVLHLVFALLYFMGINGISAGFMNFDDPERFGAVNRFCLGLMIAFMALLTKSFLLTRIKAPKTDRLILAVFGSACVLALINLLFPARLGVNLLVLMGILVPLMMALAAWNSLKSGFKPAFLFMVSWAFFMIGVMLFGATSAGLIPFSFLGFNWFQISSAVAAILLSLALADRIRTLQEERSSFQQSMKRMTMILDSMESGVFLIESKTKIIKEINQAAEQIIGQDREKIVGKYCWQFIRSAGSETCPMADMCQSDDCREDKLINNTGDEIPVLKRAKLIDLDGHNLILESFVDISDLKRAEEALRRSEAKFKSLFESSRDAVMIIEKNRYVDCNKATLEMFGCDDIRDFLGKSLSDFSPSVQPSGVDSGKEAFMHIERALSSGSLFFEWTHKRLNGEEFPAEIMLSKVEMEGRQMLQALVRDITRRKNMEVELKRLASTDPLTGADNRRSFLEKGEYELLRSLRYGHPFAFLMMDIDHFKTINDTYGHGTGDEILKTLVLKSLEIIRRTDVFGRLGGEEFAVMLPETDGECAVQIGERLRKELSELRVKSEQGDVKFTVSIGMAMLDEDSDTLTQIMGRADAALYEAKANGRNRLIKR